MPAIFGNLRHEVKPAFWKTSAICATLAAVARRPPETLADLIAAKAPTETREQFAARSGVSPRQIRNLCSGSSGQRPFTPTVTKLANALGVDPARVRAAIEASRAAAKE